MNLKKIGVTNAKIRPFQIEYVNQDETSYQIKKEGWTHSVWNAYQTLCKHLAEYLQIENPSKMTLAFQAEAENKYKVAVEYDGYLTPSQYGVGKIKDLIFEGHPEDVIREFEDIDLREKMRKANTIVSLIKELGTQVDENLESLLAIDSQFTLFNN